jgi:hypothetical protein
VVSFTPWLLYPQGDSLWYTLDRRLGGPSAILDVVVKRKIPSLHWESNPRTPDIQHITQCYTTELSQLPIHKLNSIFFNKGESQIFLIFSSCSLK